MDNGLHKWQTTVGKIPWLCVSGIAVCSTGAPKGIVLAPVLFNLYNLYVQKLSADRAIAGVSELGRRMSTGAWCRLCLV